MRRVIVSMRARGPLLRRGDFRAHGRHHYYGSLGAVIILLLWLYISFYIILLGAEINAELELQTAVDTTTGRPKPMGKRGAFVADHVAGGPQGDRRPSSPVTRVSTGAKPGAT
jgi:hypothetical protein